MSEILDCGHPPSEHGEHTTGYGYDRQDRRYCYECCSALTRAEMVKSGIVDGYVDVPARQITSWPGRPLLTITRLRMQPRAFGTRWTELAHVWAKDDRGAEWYGKGGGDGMCITMRQLGRKSNTQGTQEVTT